MTTKYEIGKSYSFDVYPVAIISNEYHNVAVKGILDEQTARMYIDTEAMNRSIYPYLPEGTPKDYQKYTYLKIKLENEKVSVIAVEWINDNTVIEVPSKLKVVVEVLNAAPSDVANIRNSLISNGFRNINISLEEQ